ncbi:MAG: hypothetical protein AB1717_06780 [Pseudomonadota bacterium]
MSQMLHSGRPLVRVRGEAQTIALNDIAVDSFLLMQSHHNLDLSRLLDKNDALSCLGHRILGKPADLRAHVQRILLLVKGGDGAALYSALLDLMITLGSGGLALKQRMLQVAQPLLAPATMAYFQAHLAHGVPSNDPQAVRAKGSLLRVSHAASAPLVKRNEAHSGRPVSAMDQANALLEYGQLEHAIELLENALLQNPDQEPEAELLLGLYRTLHEEARWHGMREQLQLSFNRMPAAWEILPGSF